MLFRSAGSHGSTFGGSPTSTAAALAAVHVIKRDQLLAKVSALGEFIISHGSQIQGVSQIRGAGLLLGIALTNADAKDVQKKLEAERILVNAPNAHTIRIAPAFVTTREDAERFLSTLEEVLRKSS